MARTTQKTRTLTAGEAKRQAWEQLARIEALLQGHYWEDAETQALAQVLRRAVTEYTAVQEGYRQP